MKMSKLGEFKLIERIKKSLDAPDIGSDCASIVIKGINYLLTCDIILEDKHFLRRYPPEHVGFKAISVNASDIVASGGKPESVLISLMLPNIDHSYVDALYRGINRACKKYGCRVVGGNVTSSDKIGVDVFMMGPAKKFIKRKGARQGDYIYVTGNLGDSKAGMELLMMNKSVYAPFEKILMKRHLKPEIEINISDYLVKNATSAMDISDGLSSDFYQLFDKEKCRVSVDSSLIPLSWELKMFCKKYRHDAVSYALMGGEDYKILFTQKKKNGPFFEIGRVEKGSGIFVDNRKLINTSFQHFRP